MSNAHGLDASLRDTFQQKQKSVSTIVFTKTIKSYNKKYMLTWDQSIHRITVSDINTRTVHRCRRIQKSDNQNSPYVNQLLLFMSTILRKSKFSSRIVFFPSLSRCKSCSYFTLEQWLLVLSIYVICLWMLRAFLWFVKKVILICFNDWVYQSPTEIFASRHGEGKKKNSKGKCMY